MTDEKLAIYGAKGGGGGGNVTQNVYVQPQVSQPTVAKDSLQSKAYARILDLLGEGEIEGLANGAQSIFFDNTPLQNAGGSFNFRGVIYETRNGTQDQTAISGFSNVETETSVGVTVEASNTLDGSWERAKFVKSSFTRSGTTLTIVWEDHGLSNGDQVWLNFANFDGPYDRLYTVTVVDTDTFTVQRYKSAFKKTEGEVYAWTPYLRINITTRDGSNWGAGTPPNGDTHQIYIRFLKPSLDITRTSSTLNGKKGVFNIIPAEDLGEAATSAYFYIAWTDKPGGLKASAIDGGSIACADAIYQFDAPSDVVTITAKSHGFTVGASVQVVFRTGTITGTKLYEVKTIPDADTFTVEQKGFSSTKAGKNYFVEVPVTSGAITRQVTDSETDRVRINISVAALQRQDEAGNIVGSEFQYAIDFQFNGGGFNQVKYEKVKGKTAGGFSFSRELTFADQAGWDAMDIPSNFPIDIRLRRVDEDSTSQTKVNAFTWQAFTTIIDTKLRYPNSALIGLEVDAQQFQSIPTRMYEIKGLKIRIPSNATVNSDTGALTYSGIWDGSFAAATWCSDPAWVLWDLLTSRRFGFGEEILTAAEKASFDGNASRLDKWSFYAASQYCGQNVTTTTTDGETITEPRFSCNVNIQSRQDAFTLINQLLSVFRTQAFWSNGSVVLAQDRPHDASYVFGASNVIEGNFSYSGSDIKTRPTVVLVRYTDLETRDVATEVVENPALIDKYGVVTEDIDAFACTSQSQANRLGKWLLYTNAYETETVSFAIGIDSGVVLRPGMIIQVSDPTRAAIRLSGRISSAISTTQIVIDVDRTVSANDTLSVVLPDGILEERTVSSYNSETRTITVSSAFSVLPTQNGIWLLTTSAVAPTTWRVVSVAEDMENGTFGVTALAYNSGKFDYVETGTEIQVPNITAIDSLPAAPANLVTSENMYENNNLVFVQVSVAWDPSEGAVLYKLRYRVDEGNWSPIIETATSQIDLEDADAGQYEVEVTAVSVLGKESGTATATFEVIGKTAVPLDVQGLQISQIDNKTAQLVWPAATDLDVLVGGKVIVRHSISTASVEWQDTNDIINAVAGKSTNATVPLLSGTYMVKFEDSTGNRSINPTAVTVTLPEAQSPLTVATFNEDTTSPPFQGDATNMLYNDEQDALILDQVQFIDELAVDGDFDALPSLDQAGDIESSGEYEFATTLDLGGVFVSDITARFGTRAFLPGDLWDDKEDLIDTWSDIDGSTLDSVNATLYVRTTADDPTTDDPVYSEWQPLVNGTRSGRGYQFKVIATSSDVTQNILIDELGATVALSARTEQANDLTSGAGSYAVTFANAFYQAPSIGISGQNLATGDFYELSSISRTGFTITFKNSGGSAVSRTFDWQAAGHGKQLA